MNFWTLIRRSLRFHARAHFGVVLGAAIGSAALIGALVVGDSVRGSLQERSLAGLGRIEFALSSPDRFVTEDLPARMPGRRKDSWREDKGYTWASYAEKPAGVLVLPALATREDGNARANRVSLIGTYYDEKSYGHDDVVFWDFAMGGKPLEIKPGEVWLNESLAAQLRVRAGDQIVLRVKKTVAGSADAALSPRAHPSEALRLRVAGIRTAAGLADFSLRPTPTPPLNAFVNLDELQKTLDLRGRVNTLVGFGIVRDHEKLQLSTGSLLKEVGLGKLADKLGLNRDRLPLVKSRQGMEMLRAVDQYAEDLNDRLQLADLEATLKLSTAVDHAELRSRRIFLDPPLVQAAGATDTNACLTLTYLANLIRSGTNLTPYSMVTAAGSPYTPPDMRDDEIILNQWLADDLQVRPGGMIELSYFLPESGAKLAEGTNRFRVHAIVPMGPPWADRTLMPDFPGIEKAESTSDWDAGFPLVHKVRPKDEDYWKRFRGTPKAFVTLAAGQKLWGNRFGNLTTIRFPIPPEPPASSATVKAHEPVDSQALA